MFLNLLPPAREDTCTEILDLLKSKRNDLTKRYFPVDENCKVLRHLSRSDRSLLIELVTWTVFILIGLLIWVSVEYYGPRERCSFHPEVSLLVFINVFKAESSSFSWPSSSRWGSSSKCSSSLHTSPIYPRSCFSNCLLLPRMSSLGTSICFHCEAAERNIQLVFLSSCFLFNIVFMWAEKSCS